MSESEKPTGILASAPAQAPVKPRVARQRASRPAEPPAAEPAPRTAPPPAAPAAHPEAETSDRFSSREVEAAGDLEYGDVEEDLRHPERLTRRSIRRDDGSGGFTVPPEYKRPGWDYEWKVLTVVNEPVNPHNRSVEYEQGWRPVPASDLKGFLPPGYRKRWVERGGQIYCMRPLKLSVEARNEMRQLAEEQKLARMKQAAAGADVDDRTRGLTKRELTAFDIVGEVGTHRPREGAET